MALNGFPHKVFGKCPRCGRGGLDDGSATGSGYELELYEGEYLCPLCIIDLQDREHDRISRETDNDENSFREKIGFGSEVE